MRQINSKKPYVLLFGETESEEKDFLKWCDRHPEGYIANGKIPQAMVVLHGAECSRGRGESWGDPTNTNVKMVSEDQELLMKCIQRDWFDAPLSHCGYCFKEGVEG